MLFPLLLAETVHLWAKRHINLDVKPPLEMLSGFPITIELSRERGQGETWSNLPKSVFVVEQKSLTKSIRKNDLFPKTIDSQSLALSSCFSPPFRNYQSQSPFNFLGLGSLTLGTDAKTLYYINQCISELNRNPKL